VDIWNPNNWDLSPRVVSLYLDDRAEEFVLLDEQDYWWACQWRWHCNKARGRNKSRAGKKRYPCRSQSNGRLYKPKLYLHVQIMLRTGILPPSPEHTIVDHRNGNEFDCQRMNLRWATPTMNRLNIRGSHQDELFEQPATPNSVEAAARALQERS